MGNPTRPRARPSPVTTGPPRGMWGQQDANDGSVVADDRSDAELLTASAQEPEAFTELYRRHAEDLLRYFARRTLDPETAA